MEEKKVNIRLLKGVENTGVILELDKVIKDKLEIRCETDGTLIFYCVGSGEKSYPIRGGRASIWDWAIAQGPNKVKFTDKDGTTYNLGVLTRNNRFLSIQNPIDEITVKLALGLEKEKERADKLEKRLGALEKEFGINVLEV